MSNNGEWMLGRRLKWYEKIILSSVITLCVFSGIYLSIWIVSIDMNIYVLFILWVFICMIIWNMILVKRSINQGRILE